MYVIYYYYLLLFYLLYSYCYCNLLHHDYTVRGHRQTIFVTVNGIGPLGGGGKGAQLKSVKNFTFVTKIEISNILLSVLKE